MVMVLCGLTSDSLLFPLHSGWGNKLIFYIDKSCELEKLRNLILPVIMKMIFNKDFVLQEYIQINHALIMNL